MTLALVWNPFMTPSSPPPSSAGPYAHHEVVEFFVFVKVPVGRHSMDPLHQREVQIDTQLQSQGLGSVLGWGDSLGARRSDGSRRTAHQRIDIVLTQMPAGLDLLRELLSTLEAPEGTEIHYTEDGCRLLDRLESAGWQRAQEPPLPPDGGLHTV